MTYRSAQWTLASVGAAALLLTAIGAASVPRVAFASYLYAFVFWLGISLGALAFVMLHALTGGRWGAPLGRPFEAAARLLPLLALLGIPLLFGLRDLYPWIGEGARLLKKSWYLNEPFFLGRALAYFALWIVLAYRFAYLVERPNSMTRLQRLSVVGLLVYAVSVTLAAVDWIMSLTPEWYSSTFGLLVGIGQMLAALAFGIVCLAWPALQPGTVSAMPPAQRFNDLGNLLLTFVMTWMYLAFTQYLIIWAGNLPEGISWYVLRSGHGWPILAVLIAVVHFAAPFAVLLLRSVKRHPHRLAAVAGLVLCAHALDVYWLVIPSARTAGPGFYWTDVSALIGIGGIWLGGFLMLFRPRAWPIVHARPLSEA